MDYLDLNIPEWQYMGYDSEEEYEEFKREELFQIMDNYGDNT